MALAWSLEDPGARTIEGFPWDVSSQAHLSHWLAWSVQTEAQNWETWIQGRLGRNSHVAHHSQQVPTALIP